MAEVNESSMEQLLNCALCPNLCRCDCPVLQVTGREAVSPAGKARLASGVRLGHLQWNRSLLQAVSNCLGCRGCTVLCPFPDLDLCNELVFSRTGEEGTDLQLPEWSPFLNNLRRLGSPYGQKESFDPGASKQKGEVLFFAGCTSLANNPGSVKSARVLLDKAGVNYCMIEEDCCGYPAESWGDPELARQLAAESCRKFSESEAVTLVTNCPECWETFNYRYASWGCALSQEVIDGPSYFLRLIKEGRLNPAAVELERVSYHDPCIWARRAKRTAEPREIIAAIPGLSLIEPLHSGVETHCCGGGRMFQLAFPQTASRIASRRLTDFRDDALIVTACPFCREGLMQEGREVLELVELLARSCK